MEVASRARSMDEEHFLPLGEEIKDDMGTVQVLQRSRKSVY